MSGECNICGELGCVESNHDALYLKDYIQKHYDDNKACFARAQGVKPQQVTKWLDMSCIVYEGKLYSPRRELKE